MVWAVDDPELDRAVEGAREGNQAAIACLYRWLNPALLRYLRHHAADVAEDLASEVWLAAAQGLNHFDGQASAFRSWLFTVARRRVVDHYRMLERRPRCISVDLLAADIHGLAGDIQGRHGAFQALASDIGQVVADRLSAQGAVAALSRDLPADQAEVILLRVLADLSVIEVARIMKRSPGAIRVLQHRALRALAQRSLARDREPTAIL